MCRLFGFRSVIQSQVHSSLVSADNALEVQSNKHADGWGVCYYMAGSPHIIKSEKTAVEDSIFKKISGIVSSETVLAHLRAATLGETSILNTHPFQFGNWVFAHNGNIKNFEKFKREIKNQISPELRRFILGSTDSELIFYFILSNLSKKISLENLYCDIDILAQSVRESVATLVEIIGNYSKIDDAGNTETYITFILTNGKTMISHQGDRP